MIPAQILETLKPLRFREVNGVAIRIRSANFSCYCVLLFFISSALPSTYFSELLVFPQRFSIKINIIEFSLKTRWRVNKTSIKFKYEF